MEIFFSILCAIFAVISCIFGVKRRVHGSRPDTNRGIYYDGSRYNDLVSNGERLEQLEQRAIDSIERVNSIKQRIRKREQSASAREPETSVTE